jgi:phosphoglycerol transferase MdoB-like AlkP superfamily enzyme
MRAKTTAVLFVVVKLLLWISLYAAIASGIGGLNTDFGQFNMEIPLVILTTLPLYYGLKGLVKLPSFVSSLPILVFYIFYDYFYWSMGRVFQWIEFGEIFELLDVLSLPIALFLIITLIAVLFLFYLIFKRVHYALLGLATVPFLVITIWSLLFPLSFVATFNSLAHKIHYINLAKNVKDNGRLMTSFYLESKRKNALNQIVPDKDWLKNDIVSIKSSLQNIEPRNIYIMVMESFIDPTLFPKLELPEDYLTPWMRDLQAFKNLSRSPVYGGSTAQAEFEILCGVPAKALVGTIEFNSFGGASTSCLGTWLGTVGYRTVAQNAYKPSYFNQVKGYEGVGFTDIYFPKEYASGSDTHLQVNFTKTSGEYMYDGDFFEQANQYFLNTVADASVGLNYMLGVYGHYNFYIDSERFPKIVSLDGTEFENIQNIVNQYYYRVRVIEQNVKEIIERDPSAVILVVSDHLPLTSGSTNYYLERGYPNIYTNVYYLWDRGMPVHIDKQVSHYDLPWILLSLLRNDNCYSESCVEVDYKGRYEQVMAHAMRVKSPELENLLQ